MSSPEKPDTRPRPQYGEYADDVAPAPTPSAASSPVAAASTRSINDARWTTALLFVGALGMVYAIVSALELGRALEQMYDVYDAGSYVRGNGEVIAQAVIISSHIALYLGAIFLARRRAAANQTTFWVPLGAGVIASIIFFGTLMALVSAQPALMDALLKYQGLG